MNRSGPLDLGLEPPRKKLVDPDADKKRKCSPCFLLGLEPPRKKPSARDDKDDTHTLKEAMRLHHSLTPMD